MGAKLTKRSSSTTSTPKPWADQPFKLISTPGRDIPKPWNQFVAGATEMANVHNAIIRYLNSIYLQAPHIAPADNKHFIRYALSWSDFVHTHHHGEEEYFFPAIEKAAEKAGCMGNNVAQHEAFSVGLKEYDEYLHLVLTTPEKFCGQLLREIIDNFGAVLTQHLHDEIETLLSLATLPTAHKIDLPGISTEAADHAMKSLDPTTTIVAFWRSMDKQYEGGLHTDFPPVPGIVGFLATWVWCWPKRKWWKWSPCDRYGRRRDMADARVEEKGEKEKRKGVGMVEVGVW